MRIEFETNGTSLNAILYGELDHHVCAQVREKIDLTLASGIYNHLILDFTNLTFMDSSGIALIMGRTKIINGLGGNVSVVVKDDKIKQIIKISGLTRYIKLVAKED